MPASPGFSHEELIRYSRHLVLPQVGTAGQARLKGARVLTVGAGGLGSPAALYLAAAGVGTIGLVDFDVVDRPNLQRQVLHGIRSRRAAELLRAAGFSKVRNLTGGIDAWSREVETGVPRY